MKDAIKKFAKEAGVEINGDKPWDVQIKNEKTYNRIIGEGSLGLGESYMDGWWESDSIDQFIDRVLRAHLNKKIKLSPKILFGFAKAKIFNRQSKKRAKIVGEKHYDIGNDLYRLMLDSRMNYSCGYWREADNLDTAQEAKLDLICKKLKLKPGMTLLDIGCGWGAMVKFAAEKYGVKAVGITISKEQKKLAQESCKGLDIEIRLQDYRDLNEKFDAIVSIGMFEHVGYKNYRKFMKIADRSLKDNGLFLLHTIGSNISTFTGDPWLEKYIFPNGMLPSPAQITKTAEGIFRLEDWHNFGPDYDKTLMAWHKNFNDNWDKIKDNYDERFKRMWNYYLLSCAAIFRSRYSQLWQIVFSKIDSTHKYKSLR